MAQSGKWEFWVDRGGTFTDLVASSPSGRVTTLKLLSENPERYQDAAVHGIRQALGLGPGDPLPPGRIGSVRMGTTVATNALLERKGEPVLLLITQGFGDLLRLGYQNRPRLFDLDIRRPDLLYREAAEIPGRLDAAGAEVAPLDETAARDALMAGRSRGFNAVAIAFLHSYLNPDHEERVARLARDIGYDQVSVSSQTSRLIKLVGRGDTTVVDAYLSPILRRYVAQVAAALDVGKGGCDRLMFMQSNGGLTDAERFQGRDAILSGPAGGIVGMVQTARAAGHDRLIGFDMGGTSTDVSHYAGRLERSFDTEVAGVRMRAPMMDIHTVAAGGGSICTYRDGRFQVGPQSAGADPGPAAYRRGGPLTVTDCNVMRGVLSPCHFPAVFGPGGDQPLDTDAVTEGFARLAAQVADTTGQPAARPEEVAAGFLRIAVDNMANAIKKISVQRGHDISGYTLNCFGGAGGQHACLVADALGMSRVFIHPFAGVLSAFGMGLAPITAMDEAQIDTPLAQPGQAVDRVAALTKSTMADVAAQGIARNRIHTEARAHLRYAGSHQTLEVPFGPPSRMRADFEARHEERFGFTSPERDVTIDMVGVEASGDTGASPVPFAMASEPAAPQQHINCYLDGAWRDTPLFARDSLAMGQRVSGPAIITEPTGTNVVEPGWVAVLDAMGNLIMERSCGKPDRAAVGTRADPVLLEVFNNLFMSVADQMGATLANTSWSVNIKERLDFSCAIFDAAGDLVANAPHVPVHLGSMSDSIRTVMRENAGAIGPGDAFMLNSPYNGGTHLPDVTVVTPVFADGRITFWLGARGHHADIGGRTPGSAPPDSRDIAEEGVLIDNFRLVAAGNLREAEARALLASGRYPCRNIDQNMADLKAQVAANATGRKGLLDVVAQFGLETVRAYMGHVQDNAQASVSAAVRRLSDGSFRYDMDHGAQIRVAVRIDRAAGAAEVDFSGTSAQDKGNMNAPASVARAVVLYVFRCLVDRPIPLNEGCLKPLRIILPEGSMLNPVRPAAVIAGNTEVSQAACNALLGALGVVACSQATMNNFVWGNERFQNYETIAGGAGAGPGFHGCDAVQTHMTNTLMTDPEVLEKRFPVRLEAFEIRPGSGGAGAWRGGHGALRRLRFLENVTVTTLSSHRLVAPFGMQGGAPGACGMDRVIRHDGQVEPVSGRAEVRLDAGDMFEIQTPGGGGWGQAR